MMLNFELGGERWSLEYKQEVFIPRSYPTCCYDIYLSKMPEGVKYSIHFLERPKSLLKGKSSSAVYVKT